MVHCRRSHIPVALVAALFAVVPDLALDRSDSKVSNAMFMNTELCLNPLTADENIEYRICATSRMCRGDGCRGRKNRLRYRNVARVVRGLTARLASNAHTTSDKAARIFRVRV